MIFIFLIFIIFLRIFLSSEEMLTIFFVVWSGDTVQIKSLGGILSIR
jgi:hypothetical protein